MPENLTDMMESPIPLICGVLMPFKKIYCQNMINLDDMSNNLNQDIDENVLSRFLKN